MQFAQTLDLACRLISYTKSFAKVL